MSTVDFGTHDGFQWTLNGMERIGVSSSSEFSRVSCAVMSPSILWWQNCLAVRFSGFHLLTWYTVQWSRCLCASISIVSRGVSAVCCGSGRSLGIGGGGRFNVAFGVVDGFFFSLGCLLVLRRSGGCGPVCRPC